MTPREAFRQAQQAILRRYDVAAESLFLQVPAVDGTVHVLRHGEGPDVVIVPGFSDPAAFWAPLLARLPAYRIHAVDRPSFGLSGPAEHTPEGIHRLAVSFLDGTLDALELDRPILVGNSIGSLWCLWYALERPQRVRAMVHVGCPAFLLGTFAPPPLRLLSLPPLGRLILGLAPPTPARVEAFARDMAGEDLRPLPEVRDLLLAAQRLPGALDATLSLLHALIRPWGVRPGSRLGAGELASITCPTLFVWGSKDRFGSVDVGREAADIVPDAGLRVIEGGGHVPWIGHPDEVADAVRPFLERIAVAGA